jgi:aldose 1-epimerase
MPHLKEENFGTLPDGSIVKRYTLQNKNGITAKVMEYGAILTELWVPDQKGEFRDVVCGFDNLAQYLKGHPFFGAIAGRYANRIARATFTLDGKDYHLAANNGRNHLHGGLKGFDKQHWASEPGEKPAEQSVTFSYLSKDGEEGYPGDLKVTVNYTLSDENELRIDYLGVTDKATVLNLTNHSYFNLAGSGDVLRHELMINANHFTPVDDELIPTGEIVSVSRTPMDFTQPHTIGERVSQLQPKPGGYDHNFVLNGGGTSLVLAARVQEPKSGRIMEVHTTEPGIQLYTSNNLDGKLVGVGGVRYEKYGAFCLETQHFPDSPHHRNFPSVVLRPGENYRSTTIFKFPGK